MSFLILGDGLLGNELRLQTGFDFLSRKVHGFDLLKSSFNSMDNYNTIINCIGCTDTYSTEKDDEHFSINADSVLDLIEYCNEHKKKLIHISTDYLYTHSIEHAKESDHLKPVKTAYGYSKLIGDMYVTSYSNDYLLIRCSFKKKPFPYDKAVPQIGNFDYVDDVAAIIVRLIMNDACGVYNVGTTTKTMLELANRTNNNTTQGQPNNEKMPKNISMDLSKLDNFLENNR